MVLISEDLKEMQKMLNGLEAVCTDIGLRLNSRKTKFMTNLIPCCNIKVSEKEIELVDKYIYLGHEIRLG